MSRHRFVKNIDIDGKLSVLLSIPKVLILTSCCPIEEMAEDSEEEGMTEEDAGKSSVNVLYIGLI